MIDNVIQIIEKFDLKLINYYRGRGAYICETNKGVKLLKEMESTVNRIKFNYYIKKHLIDKGYNNVDQYLKVGDKPYCEIGEKKYILKNWYNGRECNFFDVFEIIKASNNLATVHNNLIKVKFDEKLNVYDDTDKLIIDLKRHLIELKKIRKFIRSQSKWTEFDILFLENYLYFNEKAEEAISGIKHAYNHELRMKVKASKTICHGQYNQHNILVVGNDYMTVNFDKSIIQLQAFDLYQLIRKVMEKNNWDIAIGLKMIEEYNKERTLSNDELKFIYFMLMYPEKYWKISNYYFNKRKAWKSKRNINKLKKLTDQQINKKEFLKKFASNIF